MVYNTQLTHQYAFIFLAALVFEGVIIALHPQLRSSWIDLWSIIPIVFILSTMMRILKAPLTLQT